MKRAAGFLAITILLLAAMVLKGSLLVLPSPPPEADGPGFDANRAIERLARILGDQRPHPVDSDANDAVRERLLAELRALGLEPRVADEFACNGSERERRISCARVRNVVATIGPAEGRHLLLVSHYDSTPAGPGASDDGIGIATMLEIAHLLRGKRLGRPVTFLFNEGEETGLLGARAFLERDPLAARVDALINLESRGVTGPAIMFETSRPNGAAVALFRAGASRPVGNSLSTDLYRLIPNSTDVAVFEERRWTILNFAVIGNETRYHSAGDDLASLDRRSLQHMGVQALGATLLAATEGVPPVEGERLYTDILGRGLIVLPLAAGLILLGLLALFLLVEGRRRRALGRPLLAMLAGVAGAGALAMAGHSIVQLLRPGDYWRAWPSVTTTAVYASALAVCVIALFLAGTAERSRLRVAFWLLFVALGGGLCLLAPGAAVYFLLPPLLAALGMAAGRRWPVAERIGAIAAAAALFLTFGPALHLFEELMNGGPLWAFAPLGAAIMLPALIEAAPLMARLRPKVASASVLSLALLGWTAAALAPAYSADRQQLFTIEYVWDETSRSGRFAVNNDGAPVPFEADWGRVELPYTTRIRWAAPAPAAPVAGPSLELAGRSAQGGSMRLRFRLRMNGARHVSLIAPAEARLAVGGVPGFMRRFGEGRPDQRYFLRCAGRACDGAEFELIMPRRSPIELMLIGTRPGLPPVAAGLVAARPPHARAQYGPDATITIGRVRLP